MGVMALELMAGSTPRNAALTAAEASALAEKLGRDLASLVPQVRDLDLVMAAAHFDPAAWTGRRPPRDRLRRR